MSHKYTRPSGSKRSKKTFPKALWRFTFLPLGVDCLKCGGYLLEVDMDGGSFDACESCKRRKEWDGEEE